MNIIIYTMLLLHTVCM